jgi:hypothetical protein
MSVEEAGPLGECGPDKSVGKPTDPIVPPDVKYSVGASTLTRDKSDINREDVITTARLLLTPDGACEVRVPDKRWPANRTQSGQRHR